MNIIDTASERWHKLTQTYVPGDPEIVQQQYTCQLQSGSGRVENNSWQPIWSQAESRAVRKTYSYATVSALWLWNPSKIKQINQRSAGPAHLSSLKGQGPTCGKHGLLLDSVSLRTAQCTSTGRESHRLQTTKTESFQ